MEQLTNCFFISKHTTKDKRFPDHHEGKLKRDRNFVESSRKYQDVACFSR